MVRSHRGMPRQYAPFSRWKDTYSFVPAIRPHLAKFFACVPDSPNGCSTNPATFVAIILSASFSRSAIPFNPPPIDTSFFFSLLSLFGHGS